MSAMTPEPPAPSTDPTTAPPAAPAAPPWGADFDAERAWRLVENLRAEKEQLRQQPRMTAEQQAALDEYNALLEASQTDAQRAQAELAALRESEGEKARRLAQYDAAREHGIPLEHMDLLGSGTAEELAARADKVKALIAGQVPVTPPAVPAPGGRPVAQLRPGATPSALPNEEAADYERLFGAQA